MQCPFVNVYCEPQQWHCFEYLSVYYSKEEINIKQDFIPSSLCQVNYVHLLRLMTNIDQILIISCNIRWILGLKNKSLTFIGGPHYSDETQVWLLRWNKVLTSQMDQVRGSSWTGDRGVEQRSRVQPLLSVHDRTQVPPTNPCNP